MVKKSHFNTFVFNYWWVLGTFHLFIYFILFHKLLIFVNVTCLYCRRSVLTVLQTASIFPLWHLSFSFGHQVIMLKCVCVCVCVCFMQSNMLVFFMALRFYVILKPLCTPRLQNDSPVFYSSSLLRFQSLVHLEFIPFYTQLSVLLSGS
jgi:hypothetical protein